MIVIAEDSVRFTHSGPSQRFLRGLRPLVSVGPLPLPVSGGGHASAIPTILPLKSAYKNIAILLITKGIAIVNVKEFCYI